MARGLNAIGRGSAVSREGIQWWPAPATAGTTNDTPDADQGASSVCAEGALGGKCR